MQQHTPNSGDAVSVNQQPTYDARDLIADGATAQLVHDGQNYILRITRTGKLILTK